MTASSSPIAVQLATSMAYSPASMKLRRSVLTFTTPLEKKSSSAAFLKPTNEEKSIKNSEFVPSVSSHFSHYLVYLLTTECDVIILTLHYRM